MISTAAILSLSQAAALSAPIFQTPTHPTLSEIASAYPSLAPEITAPSASTQPFQTPTHPILSETSNASQVYVTHQTGASLSQFQVPTHPRLSEIVSR